MDAIDLKILRAMQFDARIANVDLAKQVGLSPTPCWNRVKALEEQGIIESYVTILNHAALGYPDTVIIEVMLDRHDDDALAKFEAALADLPEVIEAYLTSGEYDYYIKVAVAGTEGCEHFLRQRLHKIPGIRQSRSSFTLRCLKKTYSVKVATGQTTKGGRGHLMPERKGRK